MVETLKVVTEQEITTTTTTTIEEKYKVLAPESMQETFMSDSEDEGGKQKILKLFPLLFLTHYVKNPILVQKWNFPFEIIFWLLL